MDFVLIIIITIASWGPSGGVASSQQQYTFKTQKTCQAAADFYTSKAEKDFHAASNAIRDMHIDAKCWPQ